MDEEPDGYPDEEQQLKRALAYVGKRPRQSLDVTLAIIKQKIYEIAADVLALRARQDKLWDDYQQRLGRERLYTWWLAFLTLALAGIGAFAAFHR